MKIAAVPTTADALKYTGGDAPNVNYKNSFDLADAIKVQF